MSSSSPGFALINLIIPNLNPNFLSYPSSVFNTQVFFFLLPSIFLAVYTSLVVANGWGVLNLEDNLAET